MKNMNNIYNILNKKMIESESHSFSGIRKTFLEFQLLLCTSRQIWNQNKKYSWNQYSVCVCGIGIRTLVGSEISDM